MHTIKLQYNGLNTVVYTITAIDKQRAVKTAINRLKQTKQVNDVKEV